jgi:transcriptional regulator with XRE-family HTH domain
LDWPKVTGAELRAHRKAAGLSQATLAQRAGIGRDAVGYWEAKAQLSPRGWAVNCMVRALGLDPSAVLLDTNARAGGWGLNGWQEMEARLLADFDRRMEARRAREADKWARRRVLCGAKTRKGAPCQNKSEPGKRRCKFHGGKSTGPRTTEGRARIAEAQRKRWMRLVSP